MHSFGDRLKHMSGGVPAPTHPHIYDPEFMLAEYEWYILYQKLKLKITERQKVRFITLLVLILHQFKQSSR